MPSQIHADMTFDDLEDEILFTRAALQADPQAAPLVGKTETWMAAVDEVRRLVRESRGEVMRTDAERAVANGRLDNACTRFGDALFLDVGKQRDHKRWTQFFKMPVSHFVRMRLSEQVTTVRGWLGAKDAVLETYRAELTRWVEATDQALVATKATSNVRGQAWQAREQLAEDMTRERDALHEALAALGRENQLERSWPDLFFRRNSHKRSVDAGVPSAPAA